MIPRATAPFMALYAGLALVLFAFMHDHAFHPTDDGFVLAYSWRIAQGEFPYRDFIYERTPLSPYLHLPWLALPEGWQIGAGRLAYYVEMTLAAGLPTIWAVRRGLRATLPTLALTGSAFLLSLHNFPPMPWPTVDAVLFASAGASAFLVWIDGGRSRWLVASTVLLTLSALSKQTLAPLLALIVVLAALLAWQRRSWRVAAAALLPPTLVVGALLAILIANGALVDFLGQMVAPAQLRPSAGDPWTGDVLELGVRPYANALDLVVLLLLAALFAAFSGRDNERRTRFSVPLVMVLLVVATAIAIADTNRGGVVAYLGVAVVIAARLVRGRRERDHAPWNELILPAVVLLAAGWCAALSFAYLTPILTLGMLGPLAALVLPRRQTTIDSTFALLALAAVTSIVAILNIDDPYRDRARDRQTADLGQIYPRLGQLYTNPINAERHQELRDFTQRYALGPGRPFVVMTGIPLIHYLTGTRNPLSLDWLEPQEYSGNEDRLAREMLAARPVVLMQRQVAEAIGKGPSSRTCAELIAGAPSFAAAALAQDALVDEGVFFCVFVPR